MGIYLLRGYIYFVVCDGDSFCKVYQMKVTIMQYDEAPIIMEDARITAIDGDDITFENGDGRTTVNVENGDAEVRMEKNE